MPPEDTSQNHEDGTSKVRYYKSRDPSKEVIHIQAEDHWENLTFAGQSLVKSRMKFAEESLAEFEEIDEAEATRILGESTIRQREDEARRKQEVAAEAAEPGPEGIGGWLILPILGLIATLVYAAVWLFRDYAPFVAGDAWPYILASARSLITFEGFINLVFIVGPVVLLILLFLKRRVLPRLMVGFYIFTFLAVLADSIGVLGVGPQLIPDAMARADVGWSGSAVGQDIARTVWACAIWIPYFLVSKRVRNTFVNPPIAQAQSQPVTSFGRLFSPERSGAIATVTAPQAPSPTRPRRTRMWVLGASLVVVLAVLGALVWTCASPPQADKSTSSESAHNGSSQSGLARTYADPEHGYSFEYPNGWVLDKHATESLNADVGVYDPFGAGTDELSFTVFGVSVIQFGFQYDASMLPDSMDYIQEELDLEASQNPSFQITKPPTKTVVAGTYAIEYTCSYNTPEGVRIIETAYLVPQGSIAYVLDIQSASAAWTANRATLEAIVASFRLGPAQ